jgi:hypothetical protein
MNLSHRNTMLTSEQLLTVFNRANRTSNVGDAMIAVQAAVLAHANIEFLRTESARLDTIRLHLGAKFWSTSIDRNAIVDDIRALAAGKPALSKAGVDYFELVFTGATEVAVQPTVQPAAAIGDLFIGAATGRSFFDGRTPHDEDASA